jgi:hypothetical protein
MKIQFPNSDMAFNFKKKFLSPCVETPFTAKA